MNNSKVITILTDAITSVIEDNPNKATKLLMLAVKEMQGSAPMTHTPKRRGRKASMSSVQVRDMVLRAKSGESIVSIAESMGVSPQTAYRWHSKAKARG